MLSDLFSIQTPVGVEDVRLAAVPSPAHGAAMTACFRAFVPDSTTTLDAVSNLLVSVLDLSGLASTLAITDAANGRRFI